LDEPRTTAEYDDPTFDYRAYWERRGYEDQAERIAIRRLLHGRRFRLAVDVGGGYGRLSALLADHAERVVLADPSRRQLGFAAPALGGQRHIARVAMDVEALGFAAGAADLVTLIRVLHHLPDPGRAYAELSRVLAPGGVALIEVANQAHAMNRVRYWARGRRVPLAPVDLRSAANRERDSVPFVNHHPVSVAAGLAAVGLVVEQRLSMSNLRSARLKKLVPSTVLLTVERQVQRPLAAVAFGPSLLLLARKQGDG
jgi:SAM-dependent methyltransferase